MFAVHASHVDRERLSAPGISQVAEIAARLGLYVAILMERGRNQKGKYSGSLDGLSL